MLPRPTFKRCTAGLIPQSLQLQAPVFVCLRSCDSGRWAVRYVRLALKVVTPNNKDFVDVILPYICKYAFTFIVATRQTESALPCFIRQMNTYQDHSHRGTLVEPGDLYRWPRAECRHVTCCSSTFWRLKHALTEIPMNLWEVQNRFKDAQDAC